MTDQDYTRAAERALAQFMETERQRRVASDILSTAFRDAEFDTPVDTGAVSGTEADPNTRKQNRRRGNTRRREIAMHGFATTRRTTTRSGKAQAALDWLSRKKKTAIKK